MKATLKLNKITQIKPGVRDPNRMNIFVNQRFLCSLTLQQFTDLGLKVDQILTDEAVEEIVSLSNFGKLYQRALEWTLMRPRSEFETRKYLKNKQYKRELDWRRYEEFLEKYRSDAEFKEKVDAERERVKKLNEKARSTDFTENNTFEYAKHYRTRYPHKPAGRITDEDIEKVMEKLRASKLLDDELFAESFVQTRKTLTGVSRRRLQQELAQKGVAREVVDKVLAESGRDEIEEIQKVIANKRRRYPEDEKMLAYLARQGFSFDDAKKALAEFIKNEARV